MQARHRRILADVFAKPPRRTMRWADIESLLGALGPIEERAGSRIAVTLNGVTFHAHRPHPSPEVGPKMIKSVARFLTEAGISPEARIVRTRDET
jgi:hypothetical protein